MFRKLLYVLIGLLLVAAPVFAGTTGKIAGKIVDRETGDPLPGANVLVVGTSMGAAAGVNGSYTIMDVPPGQYTLKAQFIGYRIVEIQKVIVTVDLTTSLNFELPSQAIEVGNVVIVAERPLVNPNATNEVHVRRAEDIENMPIRGYENIVATQAGVVKVDTVLHVRGGRAEEVAFYVDGVYMNNAYNLSRAGDLITNSIEEVTYHAGGFGAEYGSANAGVVITTTKSGGSEFKFAGEAFTDEFLSKDNNDRLGTYSYGRSQYNLQLSGPLFSDRVRFFVGGEYQWNKDKEPTSGPHAELVSVEYDTTHETWTTLLGEEQSVDILVPIDESAEVLEAYGPRRGNWMRRWNFNGNMLFDYKPVRLVVGGFSTTRDMKVWRSPYELFNWENMVRYKAKTYSGYARLTHQLSPNTLYKLQLTRFYDEREEGSDKFWDDVLNYGDKTDWNRDGIINPYLDSDGIRYSTGTEAFAGYMIYGRIFNRYINLISAHTGLKLDIQSQRDVHEIKIGGDVRINTVKYYRVSPLRLSSTFAANPDSMEFLPGGGVVIDPHFEESTYQAAYAENIGFNYKHGDDNIPDRDKARKPINAAIYIQDKVELEDLVLNLGLRWDYLEPATDQLKWPDSVVIRNNTIAQENLISGETHSLFSPRIGMAFPVTERTIFHAQYGKYFQQPELKRLFISYSRFANNLQAGNFTVSGNPALKPVEQTQYEVGFQQQIGQSASLDVTGYYRELRNYVQIRNQRNSAGTGYAAYFNGDYGTVKGMTFSLDMRRSANAMVNTSYTYQIAAGTGSTSQTDFNIAWQSGRFPTFVAPMDFDQAHTGSVNFDYRIPRDESTSLLRGAGVNLLFSFGSGRRYTPSRPTTTIFGGNASDIPTAGINSGTMPWTNQLDMRLNKLMSVGGIKLDTYILVVNVFDRKNIDDVYAGSGEPDNDGWFSTGAGQAYSENYPRGTELYNLRVSHPFNWGVPRQIWLGAKFDL